MKSNQCVSQNVSKYLLGLVFLGLSLVFVVFGFTLLPIIGFVIAAPVAGVSYYFFRTHLNDQCEIDASG
jgi:uncharacterized protein (DUF697 family)